MLIEADDYEFDQIFMFHLEVAVSCVPQNDDMLHI